MRWLSFVAVTSVGLLLFLLLRPMPSPAVQAGAMVLAAGNLALAFSRPRWAIVVLFAQVPLFNNVIFHEGLGNFPPALVLFLGFFSGWILWRIRNGEVPRAHGPLDRAVQLYAAAGVISGLLTMLRYADFFPFTGLHFHDVSANVLGETSGQAIVWIFRTLLVFLAGPAMLWAASHLVTDRAQLQRVLWATALGLCGTVAFGLYQDHGHLTVGNLPHFVMRKRINATFMDPNALGSFLMLALPALAGLMVATRGVARRAALALVLLGSLYVLLLSGSRTGALGLMLTLLFAGGLIVWREKRRRRWAARQIAAGGLVIALIMIGGAFALRHLALSSARPTVLSERLKETSDMIRTSGVVGFLKADRWHLWSRPLRVTANYPVVGIGLGAFQTEVPNFLSWDYHQPRFRDNANNFYLQTSVEMGTVGLCLALLVLLMVIRVAIRLPLVECLDWREALLLSLISGSILAMVVMFMTGPHTSSTDVGLLFFMLIGAECALLRAKATPAPARIGVIEPESGAWVVVAGVIALSVLLVGQSVNAVGDLSLRERRRLFALDSSEGFYPWEVGAGGLRMRWTGKEATLLVPTHLPILNTTLMVAHPDAARNPVRVEVLVGNQLAKTEVFHEAGVTRPIRLELRRTADEHERITFRVSRTFVPGRTIPGNSDMRPLGVLVREFNFAGEPAK